GRLEQIFDKRDTPEALAAIKELDIVWLNSGSVHSEDQLSMKLRATEAGQGIDAAALTIRFSRPDAAPFFTQTTTNASGDAELLFAVDESSLQDSIMLVQVRFQNRTATRKFQLKRV